MEDSNAHDCAPSRDMVVSVLLVEDDVGVNALMVSILEGAGFTVTSAFHGEDALQQLHAGPRPNLILLDLMMPVMDGWRFIQAQKADPAIAQIPVVIVSAVDMEQTRAVALGVAGLLRKPVAVEELTQTVRHHAAAAGK